MTLKKNILRNLFCRARVAGNAQRNAVDAPLVALDYLLEALSDASQTESLCLYRPIRKWCGEMMQKVRKIRFEDEIVGIEEDSAFIFNYL